VIDPAVEQWMVDVLPQMLAGFVLRTGVVGLLLAACYGWAKKALGSL
jgi:hypothetical protein